MKVPTELLARIQIGYEYQMELYKQLAKAKIKFDKQRIKREISESAGYLRQQDALLTKLIEEDKLQFGITYIVKRKVA